MVPVLKMKEHRKNCARELLDTELQYVKALEMAIQVYLEPLLFNNKLHKEKGPDTEKPYMTSEQVRPAQKIFD